MSTPHQKQVTNLDHDLSPLGKNPKEPSIPASVNERKTGLISGKDIREESDGKKVDMKRRKQLDPSISRLDVESEFRDNKGLRITKKEHLKSKKKVLKKSKEIEIECGKGLTEKSKVEARKKEVKVKNDKPFARTSKVTRGDPMERLGKKNYAESVLPNLGESDMKYIPQGIPDYSWLKKGIEAPPNRYWIKPGRHWDGVNRSIGFEEKILKTAKESRAKEKGLSFGEEP